MTLTIYKARLGSLKHLEGSLFTSCLLALRAVRLTYPDACFSAVRSGIMVRESDRMNVLAMALVEFNETLTDTYTHLQDAYT